MNLIKGIDVTLYENDKAVTVHNVLVGEPSSAESENLSDETGNILAYTLAVPKDDTHQWECRRVEFFGKTFRTVGMMSYGIEENLPLAWNGKIRAELLRINGSCTFYEKNTFKKHIFNDVFFFDNRSELYSKSGTENSGEVSITVYAVNNQDYSYRPKVGDIAVFGICEYEFDTSSQQAISASMAEFRKNNDYITVKSSICKAYGNNPDFIIKAG